MNYLILYRDIYTFQMAKWHNSKNQEHLYKINTHVSCSLDKITNFVARKEFCTMDGQFITNKELVLSDIINSVLPKCDNAYFLVGYFYFSAFAELCEKLKDVNLKIFSAKTVRTKRRWKERLIELRTQMAEILKDNGFLTAAAANQLASWDMFDQNSTASFFDADWMFGIKDGFDIVIGNPPYGIFNKKQNKGESIIVEPEILNYKPNRFACI